MMPMAAVRCMLWLAMLAGPPAMAADEIVLYYNDRPPYLMPAPDNTATGLTATPAAQAFRDAGIGFVWARMPTNRQLMTIRKNLTMACAVGWFKTAEREQFAKFSKAIYRDKPAVALANNAFQFKAPARLADVLASRKLRVLVKDNFSYGPFIDELIHATKPRMVSTTVDSSLMVEMIRAGRADFMFVAEEEAAYLAEEAGVSAREFHLLHFSDMPPGEKRHIMCSRQVPDELINRLNKAISFE